MTCSWHAIYRRPYLFVFLFSFSLKTIDYIFFYSTIFFSGHFHFNQLLLLELQVFLYFVQFCCRLVHCSFSPLSRVSTIVFSSLSLYRFPIVFFFLLFFPSGLSISFLCYFAIVISDVFSVLFLMFRDLSVVLPTLCRTSLLLFLVVTSHRFGLVLFSILLVDITFPSFTLPFATLPPPSYPYGFPLFCDMTVINDHFFVSSAITKFLLIAK